MNVFHFRALWVIFAAIHEKELLHITQSQGLKRFHAPDFILAYPEHPFCL